jgi:hypothetical protein
MNACADRNETLMLDVYGELAPEASRRWEAHLAVCAGCREERIRLQALIGRVRSAEETPQLTAGESAAMIAALHRRSEWHRHGSPLGWNFRRGLPALAAAAALMLAVWIFTDRSPIPSSRTPAVSTVDNYRQLSQEDLEVIRNLDLLKQFQTIEKLSRVVNVTGDDRPTENQNQGASRNDLHEEYA